MKPLLVALGVCLPSWAVLGILLGNVGLQRLVSGGLERLVEQPLPMAASAVTALAAAWVLGRRRPTAASPSLVATVVWVAILNVLAGAAGVLLVGELVLSDIILTTAVVSSLGLQVGAAAVGLWLAARFPPQRAAQ
jgi:hypothetical protein